ncbi:hypothetical protein [Chitinophaga sp. 212800010-3]|uniref:hypothetical protein n=1 Tax=unclassified Chitinophaga TaxID=2619133 RepID=UPI002DEE3AC0|nr:Phage protein [Chitinophaga sp. 212800010-3]
MNFSYEELYSMYGRFDTNIHIQFVPGSQAHQLFGDYLMGEIIYTKDERESLEKILITNEIPRTDKKVRILPSAVLDLTSAQFEQAERYGVLCSDILEILSMNGPKSNAFTKVGNRELPAPKTLQLNIKRGEGNRLMFGFLNRRASRNESLSPQEINMYFGLANYFSVNIAEAPFTDLNYDQKESRYFELKAKFDDLIISGGEIEEFGAAIAERYLLKEQMITSEFERSGEKIAKIASDFGDEVKNAKKACHKFDEEILLFGGKLIYLDLERFLHIYCRHVIEMKVGGAFAGKSVFQYRYDDVIEVIKLVVKSQASEIDEQFRNNPEKNFRRSGKRAVYLYGNYYHIEIEPTGRLLTFYPYENKAAADADTE